MYGVPGQMQVSKRPQTLKTWSRSLKRLHPIAHPPRGPGLCAPGGQGWPGASHGARPRLQVEPYLAVGPAGPDGGDNQGL